jgi:hypothetical protein
MYSHRLNFFIFFIFLVFFFLTIYFQNFGQNFKKGRVVSGVVPGEVSGVLPDVENEPIASNLDQPKALRVAFIAYGTLTENFFALSKNWSVAFGIYSKVDVYYSIPFTNSSGDMVDEEAIQSLRNHIYSLNGTANLYIELSGSDFTRVGAALVQNAGEPFYLNEIRCITQHLWSQFLTIASSVVFASHSSHFLGTRYDLVIVGRFDSLAATNIVGSKCIDTINRNALPLLRPSPLEYMIEDRLMALPQCIIAALGEALSDPARLFLHSHIELNMTYPKLRIFELFVQNAFKLAINSGVCERMPSAIFEPTCVENIWSMPVNFKKYEYSQLSLSKNTDDSVHDYLSNGNTENINFFGPNGFKIIKALSRVEKNRVMQLFADRKKCVQQRAAEVHSLQEKLGWYGGLEASLRGPYQPQLRSVAVLVPLHPPKFLSALNLVKNHASSNFLWDLVFIFSSSLDADDFELSLPPTLKRNFSTLIMPAFDNKVNDNSRTGPIVTIKKWWGLSLVHSCFEFVVTIDAETLFTAPTFFSSAVRESASVGHVYQGYIGDLPISSIPCYDLNVVSMFHAIVISSISILPRSMREAASRVSKNCSLYSWFSDVPVYITSDLRSFFSDVQWPHVLPWSAFDHLIFQTWKLARNDWKSIDLSEDSGWPRLQGGGHDQSFLYQLPEFQNVTRLWANIRSRHYPGSLWRPWRFCKVSPLSCNVANGVFAIFHLDREH